MTSCDASGWLEAVLVGAQGAGWCMKPYCTTCGCVKFRGAYWAAAARQAGIANRFETAGLPQDFFVGISAAERGRLVRTLIAGLRELPQMWSNSDAFLTIIIDLDPPLLRHGVPMALDTELHATLAGEALARMRAHSKEARAPRDRQLAYESPRAVEERKRVEREKRAIAHASRQSETRQRNAERLELLAALARQSPVERLACFATDPALKLDCVTAELIPAQERDLIDLEKATAVAILARIGRRKGPWGRLRRMLEHLIRTEDQSPTQKVD